MNNGLKTLESMSQAVWYNRWTLNKFKKFFKGEILEVGCGIGNFTRYLINYGKVWAIDMDPGFIKEAKKITSGVGNIGYGDLEKGDYFFGNKKFDTVVCINVLEHIKNDIKALKNLFKLIKNNGYLILLVPGHQFLYGGIDRAIGHYRRYQFENLAKLVKEMGLKVILARRLNLIGAIGWWFSAKIMKDSVVNERKLKLFNVIAPIFLSLEDLINPPFGTSILIVAKK